MRQARRTFSPEPHGLKNHLSGRYKAGQQHNLSIIYARDLHLRVQARRGASPRQCVWGSVSGENTSGGATPRWHNTRSVVLSAAGAESSGLSPEASAVGRFARWSAFGDSSPDLVCPIPLFSCAKAVIPVFWTEFPAEDNL